MTRHIINCSKFASEPCDFINSHKEVFLNDKEPMPRTILGFTKDALFILTDGTNRDQRIITNFIWVQAAPVKHAIKPKVSEVILKEEPKVHVRFIIHKRGK